MRIGGKLNAAKAVTAALFAAVVLTLGGAGGAVAGCSIVESPDSATTKDDYSRDLLDPSEGDTGCCKICREGKACGDSCISRSYTCHKGPGCACNA